MKTRFLSLRVASLNPISSPPAELESSCRCVQIRPSQSTKRAFRTLMAIVLMTLISAHSLHGQAISINGATTYTQNFDSLPTVSGNWVDNGTLSGWYADCGNFFTSGQLNPLPLAIYTTGATGTRGFFSAGTGAERALAVSPTTNGYGACVRWTPKFGPGAKL